MNKRNKELIIIIPLAVTVGITIFTMIPQNVVSKPETFSGVMVEYNGEWIGGNLLDDGRIILLQNGTEMDYNEFKRITGLQDP